MDYTYFLNDQQVTLVNIANGNQVTIMSDDSRFESFKKLIAEKKYKEAEMLDVKTVVTSYAAGNSTFKVEVKDGRGTVTVMGKEYPLASVIVNKIVRMKGEGFSPEPLIAFIQNLYSNPSKTAIDELFLFLEQSELPITEDGHFIAYKIVGNNYFDLYSGKFDNSVGKVCEMPRFEVDDVRTNTCSSGLHFCSKGYLPHYGTGNGARCMLVKINPADVVSIPNDYNNAKGRTCKYVVVGEVKDADWRSNLQNKDYNEKVVVTSTGEDVQDDPDYPVTANTTSSDDIWGAFFYNFEMSDPIVWVDSRRVATFEQIVRRVMNHSGATRDVVIRTLGLIE